MLILQVQSHTIWHKFLQEKYQRISIEKNSRINIDKTMAGATLAKASRNI